jgi:uncharacterized protein
MSAASGAMGARGLRFHHPDLDAPAEPSGLRLAATGALATVAGDACVRQAVLLLLTTRPGERVQRPAYGCTLFELVFAPNDETTAGLAIQAVRRALTLWEPRVEILELDAGPAPDDPTQLAVHLAYRVRSTLVRESLELRVPLRGGEVPA